MTSPEFAEVCSEEELRKKGRFLASVKNREVAIFCSSDRVYAIANKCPHHGAPLIFGNTTGAIVSECPRQFDYQNDGGLVACPWHRREIDLDTGVFLAEPSMRVPTYPIKIENGVVLVGVQRNAPMPDTQSGQTTSERK